MDNAKGKVLLITDDPELGRVWAYALEQRGLASLMITSAADAEDKWEELTPDVVIIDVCGSRLNAMELVRNLRSAAANPILLLSYEDAERAILEAYKAGVDDYIVKPVSVPLFLAKVQSWVRRAWMVPIGSLDILQLGGLRLDPVQRRLVTASGGNVRLSNLELRLLYTLMSHPRRVFEPATLLDCVWGYNGSDSTALKNVVYRLRRKVEANPAQPVYIQSAAGGYLFEPS